MAKSKSAIKLQGTFGDVTFVGSRAYGDHTRARRGTYRPAPVNASLQAEGKMVLMSNVPAKLFKDAIDPYRGDMLGGTLWQRLVSFFRLQLKVDGKFDFTKLAPFDIYDDYRLNRFFSAKSTVTLDKKKSKLHVEVRYDVHPTFTKVKASDGYRLTVIGVFPDLKKKTAHTIDVASPVRKLAGAVTPFVTQLDIPSKAKEYVLCLKVEACINGVVSNTRTTTALCVINGGTL